MSDLEDYFREAKVRARVGDWRGVELAALGMVGEARRRQAEGPRGADRGARVVPDGGEVERASYYCLNCDQKFWADEGAGRVECSNCGHWMDVSDYGPWERLRDNILDANGLLGGEGDSEPEPRTDGGQTVVDAPEGGQLPRLDARRRREYERFRIADPDAEVPERNLAPDEAVLRAHGYTVADLPAPWERLGEGGASSR